MKKFLLFVAVSVLSLSAATAQTGTFVKSPVQTNLVSMKTDIHKQHAKAQLEEGQMLMGAYTSDEYGENALGFKTAGTIELVSKIDVSHVMKFSGSKLVAIRYALATPTTVSKVVAYTAKGNTYTQIASASVTGTSAQGWSTVALDAPVELDFTNVDAICLGFVYAQQSGTYPLSFVSAAYEAPTYQHSGSSFSDTQADAAGYGTLSVQGIVENVIMPEKDIVLSRMAVDKAYYKAGEAINYAIELNNFGSQTANEVIIATYIDGVETAEPLTVNNVTTQDQVVKGSITLPSDIANGTHEFKLAVKTVDGAAPTTGLEDDELTTSFTAYANEVPRQKNLIEQFTSTYCTYCPQGANNLKNFVDTRDDIAWVSVHGNMNGTDIYTTTYTDYIMYVEGVGGYPSASFNRTNVTGDVAFGIAWGSGANSEQIYNYFKEIMDYASMAPSFADINISAEYNAADRKLNVTVKGNTAEGAKDFLNGYGLTVYLTEDGLISRQLNNGRWENNYQHDHVLRYSLTDCLGSKLNWNGEAYENTFSTTLNSSWKPENMNVVAFISPIVENVQTYNGEPLDVNNAEILSLKDIVAAGIAGIVTDNGDATEVARYSSNGMLINAPVKGINIIKMSDGTTKKVVVE